MLAFATLAPVAAFADGEEPQAPPKDVYEVSLYYPGELYFLQSGSDASLLDIDTRAVARFNTSRSGLIVCDIVWDYAAFDNVTPGKHLLTGDVILPATHDWRDEPLTVTAPVLVYAPGAPATEFVTIVDPIFWSGSKGVIPLGTSAEQLETLFSSSAVQKNFWVETNDGELLYATVSDWDVSLVNTSKVGSYQPFTITLPPGVAFADDVELARYATVNVIDPNAVDLRTFVRVLSGRIDLFWLLNPVEPTVWMKTDDGEFELAPKNISTFEINRTTDFLSIYELNLTSGSVYTFQVRYENSGVSVNDFVIDLSGTRPVYSTIGGDRDGGDRGPLIGVRPPAKDDTDDEGAKTDDKDVGDDDAPKDDAQNDATEDPTDSDTTDNPSDAAQPQPTALRSATSATRQTPYDILPIPSQPGSNHLEVLANPDGNGAVTDYLATAQEAHIADATAPITPNDATGQSLPFLAIAGVLGVIVFACIAYLVVKKNVRNRLK